MPPLLFMMELVTRQDRGPNLSSCSFRLTEPCSYRTLAHQSGGGDPPNLLR